MSVDEPNPETVLILQQASELTTVNGIDPALATTTDLITYVQDIVSPETLTQAATGDPNAIMLMRRQLGLPTDPPPTQ